MEYREVTDSICKELYRNALVFLNETIRIYNTGIEKEENIVLSAANLQICLELCVKYYVASTSGLQYILKGFSNNNILTKSEEVAIVKGAEENTLKAKEFETVKNFLKSRRNESKSLSPFMDDVDSIQKYRNRVCHFVYNFSEKEKEEYKTIVLNIIFNVITFLMDHYEVDLEDCKASVFESINQDEYKVFLSDFEVYGKLEEMLLDEYGDLYECPYCLKQLMIPQRYCFSCFTNIQNRSFFGYEDCPACGTKDSVLYDKLNADINDRMPCVCLKCNYRGFVKTS